MRMLKGKKMRTEAEVAPKSMAKERIGRARFLLEVLIGVGFLKASIAGPIIPTLALGAGLLVAILLNANRLGDIWRRRKWIPVLYGVATIVFAYGLFCGFSGVPKPEDTIHTSTMPMLFVMIVIPGLVMSSGVFLITWAGVKRLRDLKRNEWWAAAGIAPFFVGLIDGVIIDYSRSSGLEGSIGPFVKAITGVSALVFLAYLGVLVSRPSAFSTSTKVKEGNEIEPSANLADQNKKMRTRVSKSDLEDKAFAEAASELDTNQREAGVWARAFSDAEGDENRAKALYIRYRAQRILK